MKFRSNNLFGEFYTLLFFSYFLYLMFSLFIECGFLLHSKETIMIVLIILLILLFRKECGELIRAISNFIANCLKQDSDN